MPDKPFFMYFAPGATHAPHHVPTEWSDKYKGRFDEGWDALREEILTRQKELGVVPVETELTARHEEIPAWEDMPDEPADPRPPDGGLRRLPRAHRPPHRTARRRARRPRRARGHARLLHHRRQRGERRGRDQRQLQRDLAQRRCGARDARIHGRADRRLRHAEGLQPLRGRLGTRDGHPYQWTKQVASHWGGTATAPSSTGRAGSLRAARCERSSTTSSTSPRRCSKPPGSPSRRPSMGSPNSRSRAERAAAYSFDGATEDDRHDTQYFEMFCNCGVYQHGWTAVTTTVCRG